MRIKLKHVVLFIFILLLIIAVTLFGAYQYLFSGLEHDESFAEVAATQTETLAVNTQKDFSEANIVNIAIFGVDSKTSDAGRSDATMILSIDYEHNKVKLTSLARDSLVYIPDRDTHEKLTHAYAYGGAQLAVKTINTNYNTNISNYIAVNFSEMADIVDLMGGVEVDLTAKERSHLSSFFDVDVSGLSTGENVVLNGKQAVAYSRIRYIDSDLERASRQREVMNSLFARAKNLSPTQYPALIKECLSLCTTSLTYTDIMSFVGILTQGDISLEQLSVPTEGDSLEAWGGIMSSSGAWCWIYDTREASDIILSFIYEDIYKNADYELPKATVDKSYIN